MNKIIYGMLAALVLPLSAAGQAPEPAVEPADIYQVELLIFRNMDTSRTTAEIARPPAPKIDDVLDQQLARLSVAENAVGKAAELPSQPNPGPLWQPVRGDGRKLLGEAARLERLEAYELLGHLSWQQSAADVADADEFSLTELGLDPALAGGTVSLYKKRYLHLALNIALGSAETGDDGSLFGGLGGMQFPRVVKASPAITDSRRIRLERLTYFDQPQFGVLAMVSKLETQTAAKQ